ncbi:MAG: 3-isopropylmalate dehydrogenase [Filifactoraceae bacterium]
MEYKIAVLKGDGIGPEVIEQALRVLNKVSDLYSIDLKFEDGEIGGSAYDKTGTPLPEETINLCRNSHAVMLGAVGGPKWDKLSGHSRPETGLLNIRKSLGLYANIRPAVLLPALKDACPLKAEIAEKGINITVIRELTGGIYFGEKGRKETAEGAYAYDVDCYSETEVRRIAKVAFEMAMKSKKNLISIDKSNVLENSKLWRQVVEEVAKNYPEVKLSHMLVDNAAMQLVKDPSQFDIMLANNMFGDILSDEAAMISGSIGILPSSSMGDGSFGLYEPIHGSAPDIAGQNIANPIATILSVAMMLRYSLNCEIAAKAVEAAVNLSLEQGYRTADLDRNKAISCSEMGDIILSNLK